jgi:hypothetical protein
MKTILFLQRAFALLAVVSVLGCQSYEIRQTCIFSDDAGRVVSVDYCKAQKPHTSTFINPATGKEVDFKSSLLVTVERDWGESFTAWQSMNLNKMGGALYKSDNGRWMLHTMGYTCVISERKNDGLYHTFYRGVLCESPKRVDAGEDKWRKMKKDAKGRWR